MKLYKDKKYLIWIGEKTTIKLQKNWMIGIALEICISKSYKALVLILPFIRLVIENYNEEIK